MVETLIQIHLESPFRRYLHCVSLPQAVSGGTVLHCRNSAGSSPWISTHLGTPRWNYKRRRSLSTGKMRSSLSGCGQRYPDSYGVARMNLYMHCAFRRIELPFLFLVEV